METTLILNIHKTDNLLVGSEILLHVDTRNL